MSRVIPLILLAAGVLVGYLLMQRADVPLPAVNVTTLERGNGPEPESVDPHLARTTQAHNVLRDLFEGLLTYDAAGELAAGVAERWDVSDDGLEYRFFLREHARWSDGAPVTAQDFVYSFRRLVDPATAAFYAELLAPVVNAQAIVAGEMAPDTLGVRAVSERELTITLERPVAHFLLLLTQPPTFPVQRANIEAHGARFARAGNLVSNGAYALHDWTLGAVIELRRNDSYWNNAETGIDIVRHHVAEEPGAELRRYLAGELDITSTVPSEAFERMQRERPNELRVASSLGVYYLGFNLTKPKLRDNPKLREALSLAIDRELIASQVVGRGELPAYSFVPPGIANYEPPSFPYASWTAAERHERARRLYEEAGYGPDKPLDVELRYNTSETHQRVAIAVQDMWREVLGFEAELTNEEFKVLVANVQAMQVTEIFRLNWNGDYNDAYSFLSILESGNPSNLFAYRNDEYDELLESAARQTDADRRRIFMEEGEALMLSEHPMIPIYFYVGEHMVSLRVQGWQDNILDYHYSQHLRIVEDR
ncbi:MAG: peptide ABC transporter substrate-binding protein [Pseudomonadota bacterium]